GGGQRDGGRDRYRSPSGGFGGGRENRCRVGIGGGRRLSEAPARPLRGVGSQGSSLFGNASGDRASPRPLSSAKPDHCRSFGGNAGGGGGGAERCPHHRRLQHGAGAGGVCHPRSHHL